MLFCKNCGSQNNEGAKFCKQCGTPIGGGSKQANQETASTAETRQAPRKPIPKKTIILWTPIGRSGTGEDIARIIAFLCEENSDLVTGTVIEATGGLNVINKNQTT